MRARMLKLMVLFGLCVASLSIGASDEQEKKYTLFYGQTFGDTAAHASAWIPVRGANRVMIRTYSLNTGAYTGADSAYSDSLAVVSFLFSDSVSFMARDSAGTIVSGPNLLTRSGETGLKVYPICADSVAITGIRGVAGDTTYKQVAVSNAPVEVRLKGSGVYSLVFPCLHVPGTTYGDGTMGTQYMRIRVTPKQRLTLGGAGSTAGIRTQGIRGLSMEAIVIYRGGRQ